VSPLPHNARVIDLLKWVAGNPNQPFDPNMVVHTTGHTSDWEWQAVLGQMEDLRRQNYIMKLKQDPAGSTYWTITTSGTNYLHALERFENSTAVPAVADANPQAPDSEITIPTAPPIPTPKKHVAPFMERTSLRIRRLIRWEEMPTHLTAHLTYDVVKYLVLGGAVVVIGTVTWIAYNLVHRLVHWMHTIRLK